MGVRLAGPDELAVWEWATTLDRAALSRAERRVETLERCIVCRERFAQDVITAVRALPPEDGALTRQVAAVRTRWTVDALYEEPSVGLGVAAAAWLSSHRVRPTTAITGWVHRGPAAFRPYTLTSVISVWVVADVDTDLSWIVTPHGRIGLAPRQGAFTGKPLYGTPKHAAGDTITYEISWGASVARSTKRVATALARLPEVPVDPGPGQWPHDRLGSENPPQR